MSSSDPTVRTPATVEAATGSDLRVTPGAGVTDATLAYERGKADARAADAAAMRERERVAAAQPRRGRGPGLLGLLVMLLAIIGAVFLFLSFRSGSFTGGGAALGHGVSTVTAPARDAVSNVRNKTGEAVEHAGDALKTSGRKIKQP